MLLSLQGVIYGFQADIISEKVGKTQRREIYHKRRIFPHLKLCKFFAVSRSI